jgi:hypothetical protein
MFNFLIFMLTALSFGLGVGFTIFGSILCYRVFFDETVFKNSIIPMILSFVFISVGLALLFGVIHSIVF